MIYVFGDVMLDEYIFGKVVRVSPEAPVPVLNQESISCFLGGAANVAKIIAGNSVDCSLAGVIGNDTAGNVFKRLLSGSDIRSNVFVDENHKTTVKKRYISGSQQILRVDQEIFFKCNDFDCLKWDPGSPSEIDVVVISDYNKGFVPFVSNRFRIFDHETVLVDPKTSNLSVYSGAFLVKPNKSEFLAMLEFEGINLESYDVEGLIKAAFHLIERHSIDHLFVTLAGEGAFIVSSDNSFKFFEGQKIPVADVTGAGDTVLAFLALELHNGNSLHDAISVALQAANIAVQRVGAAMITYSDLAAARISKNILPNGCGLVDSEFFYSSEFLKLREGKKVVFTNGCFDIFHSGHASYLSEARSLGDVLVVGINSDNSIRRLKGNYRPIIPEDERVALLRNIGLIDFCVVFDSDTPLDLIKAVAPDFLVKGSDYSLDEVVGSDFVCEIGGQVKLIDFRPGISSSKIISTIIEMGDG